MDRVSAFGDEETVELLKTRFVPVAVSLQEELRAKDGAGEFFRKAADQRAEPKHSKQGYYIVSPDGKLLKGWMYPRPDDGTMKKNLKEASAAYRAPEGAAPAGETRIERTVERVLPPGAAVVEVRSNVSDAEWPVSPGARFDLVKAAVGHDRLWVLKEEVEALAGGTMPSSLLERMLRFHLGDNTRCILIKWSAEAIREVKAELKPSPEGFALEGKALLEQGGRGYEANLYGWVNVRDGVLKKFDVVARGKAWGRQSGVPYAPVGKFTLSVGFALAKPGESFDSLPVLNWVEDYLRTCDLRVAPLRGK